MSYDQKQKDIQSTFFGDEKSGGIFGNKTYSFVLKQEYCLENLYGAINEQIRDYFKKEAISWWRGCQDGPTNLMIASQISCVNHLFWLNNNFQAADELVKSILPESTAVAFSSGFYVEFDYNGIYDNISYLGEQSTKRGTSTCFPAAMLAQTKQGEKILLAFDWRYCEKYYQKAAVMDDDDPIYVSRKKRLAPYLLAKDCLIDLFAHEQERDYERAFQKFAVEPYYSFMMQTLLVHQLVERAIENISDYRHIIIFPKENVILRYGTTSSKITADGEDIVSGWQSVLKYPEKTIYYDPKDLLQDIVQKHDLSLANYLNKRYWQ